MNSISYHKYILSILVLCVILLFIRINDSFSFSKNEVINDSLRYTALLDKIKAEHDSIATAYLTANPVVKHQLTVKASQYLMQTWYEDIVPEWIGTRWEFYGKTQVPHNRSIACGYFVSTTLSQLGIKLDRIEMAEGYSAWMVNSLCDTSYKFHKASSLLKFIQNKPDDIWIVGLSNHTGLLVKYKGKVRFVHSSYIDPIAVVDEPAESSVALNNSTIYVAGHLFVNNSLTRKWLHGTSIRLVKKF